MSLRQIVEDHSGRLTKSDRRLVQVLLSNPRESAFLSAQDLAERAAVHPTTAVRLARKLGFGGYPDLRAKLQDELIGGSQAVERVQQRLEHLGHGSLEAFVQSEVATLSALPSQISQQELEKTAETIVEGKTTFLFGYGHSEALVTLMDIRLSRSGFVTRVMREPPRHLAADIENIGAGDVVILFVFNVISPRISAILKQAKDVGAKSIVISDPIGPLLRPLPDILLSASRGEVGEARSITVPMAICNALILVISEIDEGRSINHLALVSKRRKNLRGLS